jgi:WhiB family redox-sensing transcriptional regulator
MTAPAPHEIRRAQAAALAADGWTQQEIADHLDISLYAVRRCLDGPPTDTRAIAAHINAGRHAQPARDWRNYAACREIDSELFFPNPGDFVGAATARAVCVRCPVMQACGNWALDRNEKAGVWGGLTEDERERMRRNRVRAAGAGRSP